MTAELFEQLRESAISRNLRLDAPVKVKDVWVAKMSGTKADGSPISFTGKGPSDDEAMLDLKEKAPKLNAPVIEQHCPTCTCEI